MGKKYNNQIKAGSGFTISGGYPIDDRAVVETYSDLSDLVTSNVTYEGMEVYVCEDKKSYKLIDNSWKEVVLGAHEHTRYENQHAFSSIAVNNKNKDIPVQSNVTADLVSDTITLEGGENVSITTDGANDKIIIGIEVTKDNIEKSLNYAYTPPKTTKNIISSSAEAKEDSETTSNELYLNHIETRTIGIGEDAEEESAVTSSHKIIGDGGTTVASDVEGNITISSIEYVSKEAALDGTDESLVTTGDKYRWNNKTVVEIITWEDSD